MIKAMALSCPYAANVGERDQSQHYLDRYAAVKETTFILLCDQFGNTCLVIDRRWINITINLGGEHYLFG
jgi:hypothetical protein